MTAPTDSPVPADPESAPMVWLREIVPENRVVFQCQRQWEELRATEHTLVRYCTDCAQHVFEVNDIGGLRRAIAAGRCVHYIHPKLGSFLGGAPADLPFRSSLDWD